MSVFGSLFCILYWFTPSKNGFGYFFSSTYLCVAFHTQTRWKREPGKRHPSVRESLRHSVPHKPPLILLLATSQMFTHTRHPYGTGGAIAPAPNGHSSHQESSRANGKVGYVLCILWDGCTRWICFLWDGRTLWLSFLCRSAWLNASVFFTKQDTKQETQHMAPQRGRDGLLSIETLIAGLYGVFFSIRRHLICMWLASTETIEASAWHFRLTFLACVSVRVCSQTHVCVEYYSWRHQTKGVCLVSRTISLVCTHLQRTYSWTS